MYSNHIHDYKCTVITLNIQDYCKCTVITLNIQELLQMYSNHTQQSRSHF